MNNFNSLFKSICLGLCCFFSVQVLGQCEDFEFTTIYDGCECCDSYIYFELSGGTPPYNVVTEFGQEIYSGIAANDVNPQSLETNLLAIDANGCETSGVAVFAYFCCELPPPCEISGLNYSCDEGLQLEASDIFGGPGDCEGLETISLNGNEIETGALLANGTYTFDIELEYPPCTFLTYSLDVFCGSDGSCDIEDPLSLPWIDDVVAQADCFCNYQVRYDCHNGEGLFIVEPGFPSICSDLQTFYYDVAGNLLCTGGGIAGIQCLDYDDSTGGEVIWTCGGDCSANAGTISGNETICGFGLGFLTNTAPSIDGYEYVYLQVDGDEFYVIEENYTYEGACYHGVSYAIDNPPNFQANTFSEFLSDETACYAVTPCFFVEYIPAPEYSVTTPPECISNSEFVVGISIYGGSGEYILPLPDGQNLYLIGDGIEHFVTYTTGFDFYDVYPTDAITGCGNDYIDGFVEPDCGGNCLCDDVYDPVCGVDGNTYDNACFAECEGVDIAALGACQDTLCEDFAFNYINIDCECCNGFLNIELVGGTPPYTIITEYGQEIYNGMPEYELIIPLEDYDILLTATDATGCQITINSYLMQGYCCEALPPCQIWGLDYNCTEGLQLLTDDLFGSPGDCQGLETITLEGNIIETGSILENGTYTFEVELLYPPCTFYQFIVEVNCEISACSLPPDSGPCEAAITRYYYDADLGDCAIFTWGGCEGNANNFESYELCMTACGNIYQAPGCTDVAGLDFGVCAAIMGVAVVNGECITISGCGNYIVDGVDYSNAFYDNQEVCFSACQDPCALIDCADVYDPVCGVDGVTYANACYAECEGVEVAYLGECTDDICSLPPDSGDCFAAILRYYYDSNEGDCATFTWGGCGGNANNFETYEMCMASCGNIYQAPGCTDVANVDFGDCEAIMGVAVVNGECVTVSGCLEYVIDGVDYTNAFYESQDFCFSYCQDPCALIDCSDVYDPVCGVDGVTYTNACLAECAGVAVAYNGVCTDEPLTPIFENYEWLIDIVNPNDCSDGDVITVYDLGVFSFIFIESNDVGTLYFEDGTYYCQNAPGFDCVSIYGLGNPTDSWTCGNVGCICNDVYDPVCGVDGNTYGNACEASCVGVEVAYLGVCESNSSPALFDQYTWLSSILNPNNCSVGDIVNEYDLGSYAFLFIESNGVGTLYFEDGTYYCQNAPGFDCVSIYGLGNPTDSWSCGGGVDCDCDDVLGPVVCGVDGNVYGNACEASCAGVEVANEGNCENTSNPAIFEEYSWLSSILNPNNCNAGDIVNEYDLGSYAFLFIESNGVGTLYFEDGTYYCQNAPGFDCVSIYGLGNPTDSWSCGGVVPTDPEIFEEYSWLNDLIDLGLCDDEVVTEYDLGSYSFVYVVANGESTLYFEDGTFYCQDFPNFSCLEAYGLDIPTASWTCDGLDRPAPLCTEALSPIVVCHEYGSTYRFDELDINSADGFIQTLDETCFRYTPSVTAAGDKEISTMVCNDEGVCEMVLFTIKVGNCHTQSTISQGDQFFAETTKPQTPEAENESRLEQLNALDVFTMYPNPTTDRVVIQLIDTGNYQRNISLYDLSGTLLQEIQIPAYSDQSSISIDVQNLPTGVYMIQLRTPSQSAVQRLIKK